MSRKIYCKGEPLVIKAISNSYDQKSPFDVALYWHEVPHVVERPPKLISVMSPQIVRGLQKLDRFADT